jgi:hypothetical protein
MGPLIDVGNPGVVLAPCSLLSLSTVARDASLPIPHPRPLAVPGGPLLPGHGKAPCSVRQSRCLAAPDPGGIRWENRLGSWWAVFSAVAETQLDGTGWACRLGCCVWRPKSSATLNIQESRTPILQGVQRPQIPGHLPTPGGHLKLPGSWTHWQGWGGAAS